MISLFFVVILACGLVFSILHVFDKKELVWSILAAMTWTVLAALSWSVEYVFAYESGGEVTYSLYQAEGGIWLMWFFFAIAVVYCILAYQRAMNIQRQAMMENETRTP